MRHAYIVTRIVTGGSPGCIPVPNLGVHTNEPSARRHFNSVLDDRKRMGATVRWASTEIPDESNRVIRHAMLVDMRGFAEQTEELRIERWPLNPKRKRA